MASDGVWQTNEPACVRRLQFKRSSESASAPSALRHYTPAWLNDTWEIEVLSVGERLLQPYAASLYSSGESYPLRPRPEEERKVCNVTIITSEKE